MVKKEKAFFMRNLDCIKRIATDVSGLPEEAEQIEEYLVREYM
jgi:hypothetical protein